MHTPAAYGGRRRSHGLKTKTLRRMLKKKGMKTTGKKVTLMKRLHMRGGGALEDALAAAQTTLDEVKAKKDAKQEEIDAAQKAVDSAQKAIDDAKTAAEVATPPVSATGEEGGRRRRRRSRRREEGGSRRRKHTVRKEMLGF